MRTITVVLVGLALLDVVGCGLLLLVAWVEHRRVRRAAAAAGEPVPPSAAGTFAALAAGGLAAVAVLYGLLWLAARG